MAVGLNPQLPETALRHPIFDPVRRILERVLDRDDVRPLLDRLSALAAGQALSNAGGRPIRFIAATGPNSRCYEEDVFETGEIPTRGDNHHDLFNAIAWLAFPKAKATINRLHVEAIRRARAAGTHERGPLRDLLTLLDESGAIVACPPDIAELIVKHRWRELFWGQRPRLVAEFRIAVLGHAVLEKALAPWPGVTCKLLLFQNHADLDATASEWLGSLDEQASPRRLPVLPVFGLPEWLPETRGAEFYDDARWFRSPAPDKPAAKSNEQRSPALR